MTRKTSTQSRSHQRDIAVGEASDRLGESISVCHGLESAVRGEASLAGFDPSPLTELIELHRLKLERIRAGLDGTLGSQP